MFNFLLVFYIAVVFFLIFFILLSKGKGSEIGALSSSEDFFGPKNSNTLFNKLVIIFVLLTVFLNFSLNVVSKSSFYRSQKPIVNVSDYEKQ